MIQFQDFTDADLSTFRRYQRTSYDVLSEVADQLVVGATERDATRLAMKAYRREGADRFFHLPVALFGARTALPEPWTTDSFWPSDQALVEGDAVVLDASPIFGGYVVDTSLSFSVGASAQHAQRRPTTSCTARRSCRRFGRGRRCVRSRSRSTRT